MLNNKNIYYLQQIGIDIWETRSIDTALSSRVTQESTHKKIMVIVDELQNETVKLLLNQMLRSIDVMPDTVALLEISQAEISQAKISPLGVSDNAFVILQEYLGQKIHREIELIQPQVILLVTNLLITQIVLSKNNCTDGAASSSIDEFRGRMHYYGSRPLIVSYSPSDLLSNSSYKKKTYQDLLLIRGYIAIQPEGAGFIT